MRYLRREIRFILPLLFLFASLAQGQELRVGTTLSLTGAYALYGQQALNGMQLAIEEVNAAGGVNGRKVSLFVEDFGTLDLRRAVSATRKLLSVDKVELMLPLIIEDSEVIVPITTRAPVFTVAVGCGARKCGFNVGPYHVRAASSHDLIVQALVGKAQEKRVSKPCVIAAEATYFEGYGRYIEELLRSNGLNVWYENVPLSNSEDYREVATRFKQNSCDAIFAWIPIGSSGSFYRRVRESGSKAIIFGIVEADDPGIISTAGQAAEGVIFARFSLGSEEFQNRYRARFGSSPSRPAIPSYDVVKLLLNLSAKVGTTPQALKAEFLKVKDYPATNGKISYDSDGERLGEEIELMEIRGGIPQKIGGH